MLLGSAFWVVGAHSVLRFSRQEGTGPKKWAADLLARKPHNVIVVALGQDSLGNDGFGRAVSINPCLMGSLNS
ncbi:hypothetical protein N184_29555 [Sinorhizobium sp. GL28]|nr:hypothetical protein N184_29555 [Sinorhizobium sp. GL28]